jgi:hypothetical protein
MLAIDNWLNHIPDAGNPLSHNFHLRPQNVWAEAMGKAVGKSHPIGDFAALNV